MSEGNGDCPADQEPESKTPGTQPQGQPREQPSNLDTSSQDGGNGGRRILRSEERQDLYAFARAVRQGWDIPADVKRDGVARAAAILRTSKDDRAACAALRALIQADAVDARREANASQDDRARVQASVSALRAALQTDAGRQAAAQLAAQMTAPQPLPAIPAAQTPPADAGSHDGANRETPVPPSSPPG